MNSNNACNRSGPSTRRSTDAAGERGFALIAVVGVLAVLSVIAVALSERGRIGTSAAGAFLEETRDLYAVEAGVTAAVRAIALKSEFDGEGQLRLEATVGDRHLDILITDGSWKIDANRASSAEMAEGLTALGVDAMTAQALSHRLIDWRDPGDRPQPGGAETADYLAAGMPARPRNNRFVSLDEVETVLGMPLEIAARLHEQFTVTPVVGGRAGLSATATDLNAKSFAGLERQGGDVPSSDGITRSADATSGSSLFGIQIKLKRVSGRPEGEYFKVFPGGGGS